MFLEYFIVPVPNENLPCIASECLWVPAVLTLLYSPGRGKQKSPIAFCPIVGDTKHLAVISRTSTALAPGGNVVCVHFGEIPYLAFVGSMADCAERAV